MLVLTPPNLIETSFTNGIEIIAAATVLPEQTRRHWTTSLRMIAKALDKPLEVIPARYSAVRADMAQLHEVPVGWTPKTLANHKSNVKAALLWLAREKGIPAHGTPMSPAWEQLRAKITDPLVRAKLSSLMRFCSANQIAPNAINEEVIERLLRYRASVGKSADPAFRRLLARAWNQHIGSIPGWPTGRLTEPPVKSTVAMAWTDFPEGLRCDVDQYLEGLTRIRRSRSGKRIRPLRPSTIDTRRRELEAAARMAVETGLPIERLTSLSALLAPEVAEKVLDSYWRRNGEMPKLFTIDLARRFFAIAKETKCLDDHACERLDELRLELEEYRQGGLTPKNQEFLRRVLTPGVWGRIIKLPFAMMAEARRLRERGKGIRAAVTAQLAVSIGILSVAPVRLGNLASIRLGFNLIKPDGPDSNYWLVFPDYDVKNRVKLDYPLPEYLTRLIDEYVFQFRPCLLRGRNEDWLFPGLRAEHKGKICLSGQIAERIYKATGMRMTVHQFRHAAGALVLTKRPGEYELVRRLLGHRNVQTTINSYIGLENIQASEIFSKIVMEHLNDGPEDDQP